MKNTIIKIFMFAQLIFFFCLFLSQCDFKKSNSSNMDSKDSRFSFSGIVTYKTKISGSYGIIGVRSFDRILSYDSRGRRSDYLFVKRNDTIELVSTNISLYKMDDSIYFNNEKNLMSIIRRGVLYRTLEPRYKSFTGRNGWLSRYHKL